jgi:glycosyltransferase involved in cell wall biosynthesis
MFGRKLKSLDNRGPLRVMFVITNMPVGGAETLLVEIIRRLDRDRFQPELCCLKEFGPLGEMLAAEIPAFSRLLKNGNKYDFAVLWRLVRLLRREKIDAVVTVGTGGDKMFWGRLAGWIARVPVICSSLHSTGLPDHVEFLNRRLAWLTDAFVAVAKPHSEYLISHEGCPARKVIVIPNGVDTERFKPRERNRQLQEELDLAPDAPVVGIVAALRPEKNHEMFLRMAAAVLQSQPKTRFLIVGDGPERSYLEAAAKELGVADCVRFVGTRKDVPELLALMDVVLLTSHMEANPVCLLEAMAAERPVIATAVGSVPETVLPYRTGYLVDKDDAAGMARRVLTLFADRAHAAELGKNGREFVAAHWSVENMVQGYEDMIAGIYCSKRGIRD